MSSLRLFDLRSWVSAWLFFSCAVGNVLISEPADRVTGLTGKRFLTWEGGVAAVGVAMTKGSRGEIYALFDTPPSVVVWESGEFQGKEFSGSSDFFITPVDIVTDGGLDLLVADPWRSEILRFNRRFQKLPSVVPDFGQARFEPLSVCRISDGTICVVNQADNDVWRIDRDGKALPMGWSFARVGRINAPLRIRYLREIDKLLILDNDGLKLSSLFGAPGPAIKTKVSNSSGFGVSGLEVWIAGDGLACISLLNKSETFYVPPDSLNSWGIFPVVDVVPDGDQLYILPLKGGQVLIMEILRDFGEHH